MNDKTLPLAVCVGSPIDRSHADDTYAFLEEQIRDGDFYRLDRSRVAAAGIEFLTILYISGSIASLASLLWMAYERIVARRNKDEKGNAVLCIVMDPEKNMHWYLGDEYQDVNGFIQDFEKKIKLYFERRDKEGFWIDHFIQDVKHSPVWVKTEQRTEKKEE